MNLIFKQKHTPLTVAHKTSKENRKCSAKGGTLKYYNLKISPKMEEQKQGYGTYRYRILLIN